MTHAPKIAVVSQLVAVVSCFMLCLYLLYYVLVLFFFDVIY